jgi:thiol-disulfide isomerase/thioredoxin
MKKIVLIGILLLCIFTFSQPVQAQVKGRLIVFTTEYCPYCKAFMQEVGEVYDKTRIGGLFPMTEVDNHAPPLEFEDLSWQIRYYPTAVVIDQSGRELARFRGYRGEEFFWGEMESLLKKMATPNNL